MPLRASGGPRTPDPLLTKQPLCHLSYGSMWGGADVRAPAIKLYSAPLLYWRVGSRQRPPVWSRTTLQPIAAGGG